MTTRDGNVGLADVYSGDVREPHSQRTPTARVFVFKIEADPEPDVLARVASIFNIANSAPRRATLQRDSTDSVDITVAIELCSDAMADMIRRKLEQLTCTLSVHVFAET